MGKFEKITAKLDAETMESVRALAEADGVTEAVYAAAAIRRVVESEADYRAFIQEGIDAADRGDLISHDQVMAELDLMIESHRVRCRP